MGPFVLAVAFHLKLRLVQVGVSYRPLGTR